MSGRAGTITITTVDMDANVPDGPGKVMLTKTSRITFSGVDADIPQDLKIAFLVKNDQDVDELTITSDPTLLPRIDRPTAVDARKVFGLDSGDKWVGWKIPYVGHWSTTLDTKMRLRKFSDKPKHVQYLPIMFAFAIDLGGDDYGNHFLSGVSACMGEGHTTYIETQTIFI